MREIIWRGIAAIVSRPAVSAWIIKRAQRTPYSPIRSRDGAELYMDRWWLFNPYSKDADGNAGPARWSWLPSVRVHHILRADSDDHLHDHPWNARTIVLREWYEEERPWVPGSRNARWQPPSGDATPRSVHLREQGYTGRVLFGEYHRISFVPSGGVYTLWFTWKYRGTWGFDVNGRKVPWRKYLGLDPKPMASKQAECTVITRKMYEGADSMWGAI